jgi:hypothetical protein
MIYRFKVWFEEDEEIYRVIDIAPTSTFLELFNVIINSIGFNKALDSSIYVSDDNWRKRKEISLNDKSKLLMSDAKLNTHINDPHQRFILVTDFKEEWTLNIELKSIENDIKGIAYPFVSKTQGKAPKQTEGVSRFIIVDENEFDELANKMLGKTTPLVEDDFNEEGYGEEGEDIDNEDEDEFGEIFGDGEEEIV